MKKIVAFAGSNSSRSINGQLINFTLENFKNFEVEFLDLNDFEMPIFSIDREKKDGVPQSAVDFRKKLHEADGIIISVAEHNWTITVAMKNLLDWCSRVDMNIFDNKPMLLMSVSISRVGGARAMGYMLTTKEKFNMNVVETFSLPSFNHTFAEGRITDEELNGELKEKIGVFINSLS
jgi:NAD(P)H-dependent FMN reductase